MFHFCSLARALGDENRVRILMALRTAPLCVCQLTALLDLAPSTTSRHLSLLRQARLIECCKQGRWAYYRLPQGNVSPSVAAALEWVRLSLIDDADIAADSRRIRELILEDQSLRDGETACCHSSAVHALDAALNRNEEAAS